MKGPKTMFFKHLEPALSVDLINDQGYENLPGEVSLAADLIILATGLATSS